MKRLRRYNHQNSNNSLDTLNSPLIVNNFYLVNYYVELTSSYDFPNPKSPYPSTPRCPHHQRLQALGEILLRRAGNRTSRRMEQQWRVGYDARDGSANLEIFDEAQAEAIDQIEAEKRVSGQVRFALLTQTFIPFYMETYYER